VGIRKCTSRNGATPRTHMEGIVERMDVAVNNARVYMPVRLRLSGGRGVDRARKLTLVGRDGLVKDRNVAIAFMSENGGEVVFLANSRREMSYTVDPKLVQAHVDMWLRQRLGDEVAARVQYNPSKVYGHMVQLVKAGW